jgi:hypothetical protein
MSNAEWPMIASKNASSKLRVYSLGSSLLLESYQSFLCVITTHQSPVNVLMCNLEGGVTELVLLY